MIKTLTALIIVLLVSTPGDIMAQEDISTDKAVHAILGEARGEGYIGMYAVACAIRNRGTLKGVYGLRAKFKVEESTKNDALNAWIRSEFSSDITRGATHWENVGKFGLPAWARHMVVTAKVGNHTFFREVAK